MTSFMFYCMPTCSESDCAIFCALTLRSTVRAGASCAPPIVSVLGESGGREDRPELQGLPQSW
jgi:hypothetical protein